MSTITLDEKQYIKALESALSEKTVEAIQLRAIVNQMMQNGDDSQPSADSRQEGTIDSTVKEGS